MERHRKANSPHAVVTECTPYLKEHEPCRIDLPSGIFEDGSVRSRMREPRSDEENAEKLSYEIVPSDETE